MTFSFPNHLKRHRISAALLAGAMFSMPAMAALDDAKATVEVLHGLLERLGSLDITTLEALLDFAKTAAHIQRQNYWGMRST